MWEVIHQSLALQLGLIVAVGLGVVSAAGWVAARFFPRRAAVRHVILFWALMGCVLLPGLAWVSAAAGLTLIAIPVAQDAPAVVAEVCESTGGAPYNGLGCATTPTALAPPPTTPVPVITEQLVVHAVAAEDSVATEAVPTVVEPLSPVSVAAPVAPASNGVNWLSFRDVIIGITWVWGVGTAFLLVRLGWNCLRVVRLRRSSGEVHEGRVLVLLREVAAGLGMARVPLLLTSKSAVAPLAVGLGRPAIILPEALIDLVGEGALRDVLAHEAAHLGRGDQRVILVQALAAAIYWPIVSIHFVNRELHRAREELCDNVVLAQRDPVSYGKTLLGIAELLLGARRLRIAAGILGRRGELERRIARLLDPRRSRRTSAGRTLAWTVMCACVAAVIVAATTRFADSAVPAVPRSLSAVPPPPADPDDPRYAGHFSGQVLGPDGKPFRGAKVYAVSYDPNEELTMFMAKVGPVRAETDVNGRFAFDAPDMTYVDLDGLPARRYGMISVTAEGHGPDLQFFYGRDRYHMKSQAERIQQNYFEFRLAVDDVPIHGRFLDPQGNPLANARVKVESLHIPRGRDMDAHLEREKNLSLFANGPDYASGTGWSNMLPISVETKTDAEGRFRLTGLGRDRMVGLTVSGASVIDTFLSVATREMADLRVRSADIKETSTPAVRDDAWNMIFGAGFTLKLKPGRTISGVVRDRETRAPIPGMWVGLGHGHLNRPPAPGLSNTTYAVSDREGRFSLSGIYPGLLNKLLITAVSPAGIFYVPTSVLVEPNQNEAVIEARRGIPFRLKLLDEQGKAVEAAVTSVGVRPNPHLGEWSELAWGWRLGEAMRRADGVYEGFVMPGPGAVLVKMPAGVAYRPARVDPKGFFAAGRTIWTEEEARLGYGTLDTLVTNGALIEQNDYAAIVLVNPAPNSGPLELSATVARGSPRVVRLVDPEGSPVSDVRPRGIGRGTDYQPPLRAASFTLSDLHPDRPRGIAFLQAERQLIGGLVARGDGDMPFTVRMERWGTLTGRLVGEDGGPLPIYKPESNWKSAPTLWSVVKGDVPLGETLYGKVEADGRFRIEQVMPGRAYIGRANFAPGPSEISFDDVVLRAGEVRDLGDIRTKLSYVPNYARPKAEDQQALAAIPAEAWGKPVNGLRVAVVMRSPMINERDLLLFQIVAENVGEQDIRFGAGMGYESAFYKVAVTDAAGKVMPREPGTLPRHTTQTSLIRCWLKPGERMVISDGFTKLVRLDETGRALTERNQWEPFVSVKPGRYAIATAVELGTAMAYDYDANVPVEMRIAAKGEWVGKLQTGSAVVTLFENAR